jgi:methionyl-tRNA synthetase
MSKQTFYLTTPIYYVNARPHIGHAYSTIAADVIARRHRLLGDDTFFLTGTDEHGQKVERSAAAAGVAPQQFADEVSASFRALWDRMGITYNDYIRTTDERHKQGVQRLWRHLEERGAIYLSTYTGQYSIGEEMFVEGPPGTIGPDGKPTETVTEENYFFKLSEYQLPLIDLIESGGLVIQPESSRNEVLSFLRGNVAEGAETKESKSGSRYVEGALKDLSISRSSFKWGIPVPGDEKHVIYVWLDALANYMTAIGYGSDDPAMQEKFAKYWPADLHLVGKEITRFHCVYWPTFLLAAGIATPKSVVANGWLLFDDSKMSKSKGNVVRTETILDAFGTEVYKKQFPESTKKEQDLFGADVLRYFLLREIPFGQDGSFSFDALITRYNAELVNGYGNLVSRVLTLINQSQEGLVPDHTDWPTAIMQILEKKIRPGHGHAGHPTDFGPFVETPDIEQARLAAAVCRFYDATISRFHFSIGMKDDFFRAIKDQEKESDGKYPPVVGGEFGALDYVWLLIGKTDELLSLTTPWKLAKLQDENSQSKLRDVLYIAAESIRIITALLYPIIPYATSRVWSQLGMGDIELASKEQKLILTIRPVSRDEQPAKFSWGGLEPGTKLGELAPIFPRADKGLAQIMIDMENPATPSTNSTTTTSPASATPPTPSKLVDEKTTHTSAVPTDPTHPGAAPRTSALADANPGMTVGGSHAISTERPGTPSHAEAPSSGPFANSAAHSETPDTPQIAIDDFVKIDLRVAQIVVAERIPKADKLLRLEVDLGYEKRQILSGIAEWYTPEELIGRKIVVIANLAPRKMRGLESHGMLLAASHGENGKPVLATFGEEIALGSRLR